MIVNQEEIDTRHREIFDQIHEKHKNIFILLENLKIKKSNTYNQFLNIFHKFTVQLENSLISEIDTNEQFETLKDYETLEEFLKELEINKLGQIVSAVINKLNILEPNERLNTLDNVVSDLQNQYKYLSDEQHAKMDENMFKRYSTKGTQTQL